MGKRELLLIAAFVVVGAIVYQFTAPPPADGERSFQPGQVIEHIRRAIAGNRASAEIVNRSTQPVEPDVSELRFEPLKSASLTIIGEDRSDIDAELRVHSNAYDEQEAQQTAKQTVLKADRAGARLVLSVFYPDAGIQRATVILKVPRRLGVRLQGGGNELTISHVSSLELGGARGKVEISDVSGLVSGSHRGGELHIANAGTIKITTTGTDAQVERVHGEMTMTMRGGELKGSELAGPVDLDTNGTDVTLEQLDKTSGIVHVNAVGGSLAVKGLRTEGRFDVRNTDVEVSIERAAPLAIYSDGGDSIEVTPPSGGYQLDAVASEGTINLPPGTLEVTSSAQEHRATGPINGGGPTITIRNKRGDITIKER